MNYKKTCWYCGKDTMVAVSTWFKCTSCGATWVEQPTMTGTFIDIEPIRGVMSDDKISRKIKRRRTTLKRR